MCRLKLGRGAPDRFVMLIRLARNLWPAARTIAALVGVGMLSAGAAEPPRCVVELFTSQGCSSCPPADRLVGDFAGDPGVVTISWPVDYWDYIGWKDTLAQPA